MSHTGDAISRLSRNLDLLRAPEPLLHALVKAQVAFRVIGLGMRSVARDRDPVDITLAAYADWLLESSNDALAALHDLGLFLDEKPVPLSGKQL